MRTYKITSLKKILSPPPPLPRSVIFLFYIALLFHVNNGQDAGSDDYGDSPPAPAPPPGQEECNGIFLTYSFTGREKELPYLKNASAQAWAFKAMATIVNAGTEELKAWKMYVGFHRKEVLVSASGATIIDGADFPAPVGNGTTFVGNPLADLKTSVDTAGDYTQISVQIEITGTQFGVKPPGVPMPKTLKLMNDGYVCPGPTKEGSYMHVCCKRNPKYKAPPAKSTKFAPRQNGDLSMIYDVIQAYSNNYLAQVTIDNMNPLGRLDHWNLTWEWQNGEFISTMRGAYTHKKGAADCLYGPAGKFYKDFDFSNVQNCEKKPIISDLPADRKDDEKIGKLPYCCRNGSILPKTMNESKSRSIFQLQVYKLPPNDNRTALVPPMKWAINGLVNPNYKCGPPIRVEPTEFPDPSGLQSYYYCSGKLSNTDKCNPKAKAMLLPSEAQLVPFENRTAKAVAWASLKHKRVPKPMPCPDNCGVSLNWHINSDYKDGWSARLTLFNWGDVSFEDWFTAVKMDKVYAGYENVYSFNGTRLPQVNKTLFFQGLEGLNYLMAETNGTKPGEPRVPGKQQSVISFTKKHLPNINIQRGDGFPTKVFFNGEECTLPTEFPIRDAGHRSPVNFVLVMLIGVLTFMLMQDQFH
ncbi:hypothetical protein Patl1_04302 [Pistacia atlantica]|uniref:Uncharacterized protein n=1 Tax=Pistacia atlantica TaxID=434234 RepID=A0ACC1BRG0_9ROSI|nr:hypothetical protein Patl1_04302 [Pistacia atlantica]